MTTLQKHPNILQNFAFINIDVDPKTKQRPQIFYQIQSQLGISIKEVPTIVVNNNEYVLSGTEAFKWLEYEIENNSHQQENLQGYNPNEMGSFSDSYASIGSKNMTDATDQSFYFLGKPSQKINTPKEDTQSIKPEVMRKKQQERESVSSYTPPQQSFRFTPEQFGNDYSKKDMENRYAQLLAEREELTPKPPNMNFRN